MNNPNNKPLLLRSSLNRNYSLSNNVQSQMSQFELSQDENMSSQLPSYNRIAINKYAKGNLVNLNLKGSNEIVNQDNLFEEVVEEFIETDDELLNDSSEVIEEVIEEEVITEDNTIDPDMFSQLTNLSQLVDAQLSNHYHISQTVQNSQLSELDDPTVINSTQQDTVQQQNRYPRRTKAMSEKQLMKLQGGIYTDDDMEWVIRHIEAVETTNIAEKKGEDPFDFRNKQLTSKSKKVNNMVDIDIQTTTTTSTSTSTTSSVTTSTTNTNNTNNTNTNGTNTINTTNTITDNVSQTNKSPHVKTKVIQSLNELYLPHEEGDWMMKYFEDIEAGEYFSNQGWNLYSDHDSPSSEYSSDSEYGCDSDKYHRMRTREQNKKMKNRKKTQRELLRAKRKTEENEKKMKRDYFKFMKESGLINGTLIESESEEEVRKEKKRSVRKEKKKKEKRTGVKEESKKSKTKNEDKSTVKIKAKHEIKFDTTGSLDAEFEKHNTKEESSVHTGNKKNVMKKELSVDKTDKSKKEKKEKKEKKRKRKVEEDVNSTDTTGTINTKDDTISASNKRSTKIEPDNNVILESKHYSEVQSDEIPNEGENQDTDIKRMEKTRKQNEGEIVEELVEETLEEIIEESIEEVLVGNESGLSIEEMRSQTMTDDIPNEIVNSTIDSDTIEAYSLESKEKSSIDYNDMNIGTHNTNDDHNLTFQNSQMSQQLDKLSQEIINELLEFEVIEEVEEVEEIVEVEEVEEIVELEEIIEEVETIEETL